MELIHSRFCVVGVMIMAKEFAKPFYRSKQWKRCREAYISSVNGLCERCLAKGKIVPGYIVHHKTHLTPDNIDNPDIALGWDNLEYTCQDCHNREHHGNEYEVVREGFAFDVNGDLIQVD